jgi:hypothetical protein
MATVRKFEVTSTDLVERESVMCSLQKYNNNASMELYPYEIGKQDLRVFGSPLFQLEQCFSTFLSPRTSKMPEKILRTTKLCRPIFLNGCGITNIWEILCHL